MNGLATESSGQRRGSLRRSVREVLTAIDSRLREGRHPERTAAGMGAIFAIELILFAALKLPLIAREELFLFLDWGANLTVQNLLDHGLRPLVDFYYPYGLFPLMVGRVWFTLFGRTPWAYLGAVAACHVLVAWGLARCLVALRTGLIGVLLVLVAMPYAVPATYPNLAHGIETALLAHCLAELAAGRLASALAIATAAAFTKPSMAYVLGTVLAVQIVLHVARSGRINPFSLVRGFGPAIAVGLFLAGLQATLFGIHSLVASLMPLAVARVYRASDYGFFFGIGRRFWLPPDARLAHYLGTPRAYWTAATCLLLASALAGCLRSLRSPRGAEPPRRTMPFVLACAGLHLTYLMLFFGGEASWIFYAEILVLGVAALVSWGGAWGGLVLAVAVLALVADRSLPREIAREWRSVNAYDRKWGLWTTSDWVESWDQLRAQIRGERPVLACMAGCEPMLGPDFAAPTGLYLNAGMDDSTDVRRKAEQILASDTVVIPTAATQSESCYDAIMNFPAIHAALADFELAWHNRRFEIYRRRTPAVRARSESVP